MDAQPQTIPEADKTLPLTAKTAAIYLLFAGITSIPLLFVAPSPEFLAQPPAARAGHYTREIILDLAFVVAGIAVLRQRTWARKLGVIVLIISALHGAFAFARGFARGAPSPKILLIGFLVVGAWNALWIYFIVSTTPRRCHTKRLTMRCSELRKRSRAGRLAGMGKG
ncbi:MAG: hypothetical protein DME97_13430 [Verrucomicrobia bacterium]|nr:MAG: hypothetical protein DME97_13430 [Verrucomicrobiota bacterium]